MAVSSSLSSSHFYYAPAAAYRSAHRRNSCGLWRKCRMVAKQQKTRFYILGRCISMLLCWHDHTVSD
ncbi:unnamed protein product [Spirodela intermedia]|uniref:Uncharacterized protein n=1 Tax=Spirodela intermedia TaxID=51605 RepID=A0A7I8KHC4_SPIIN|nr:unnamed protein product [Spirodela intermedia]